VLPFRRKDRHRLAYKIRRKSRQSVVLTQRPAIFHQYILILGETCLAQASPERIDQMFRIIYRWG
jgi:hypothetical protein